MNYFLPPVRTERTGKCPRAGWGTAIRKHHASFARDNLHHSTWMIRPKQSVGIHGNRNLMELGVHIVSLSNKRRMQLGGA